MLRGLKQEGSIRLLTFIDALECSLARDSTPHEVRRRSSVYLQADRELQPRTLVGEGFDAARSVLATPTGRVYKARFQRPDGTKIDFRIGLVEDWSLSKAREQAEKCVEAAKTGDDPQVRKRKAKSKEETFGVLAEKCMKSLSLRPNTRKNWNGLVKNYLIPKFGNIDAASIDIAQINQRWPKQ